MIAFLLSFNSFSIRDKNLFFIGIAADNVSMAEEHKEQGESAIWGRDVLFAVI